MHVGARLSDETYGEQGQRGEFFAFSALSLDGVEYSQVDMMSWLTRAASELIGSCAFGSSFDSLDVHEHQHPYITAIKSLRCGQLFTILIANVDNVG